MFGKELFILFTVLVFRKCLSICGCAFFLFGLFGRLRDLIVLNPDHYIFFIFYMVFKYEQKVL